MHKLTTTPCRKCGGDTKIYWDKGEEECLSINFRPAGMIKTCLECGFKENINDLESKVNADNK